jgi:hypothetical protein
MAREAYYEALRDLGIARDSMQQRIGAFHAEVTAVRNLLMQRAPMMVPRLDKAIELTVDHLMDDLLGDEPALPDAEAPT